MRGFLDREDESLPSSLDLDTVVVGWCQGCARDITGLHRISVCPEMNCTTKMHTVCAVDGFSCHPNSSESD